MTTVKRRMTMLVAVLAMSGVTMLFSPTNSAQAVPHEVCAGTGAATLAAPFVYPFSSNDPNPGAGPANPGFSSVKSTTFTFHLTTGTCAPSLTSISASGFVHGHCGLSVGDGTTSKGDNFSFIGVGGTLAVTGQVEGVVNAAPNAALGDTCLDHQPGANDFIINGGVIRQSCGIVATSVSVTSLSVGAPNTSQNLGIASAHTTSNSFHAHSHSPLPVASVSITLPGAGNHYHFKLHGCF